MTPEAGELNERGQFFKLSSKQDRYGDTGSDVWEDLGTYWGKLTFVSEANQDVAKGASDSADYQWLMRYRDAIDSKCKVVVREQTYLVKLARHDPTSQRQWTQCFLATLDK